MEKDQEPKFIPLTRYYLKGCTELVVDTLMLLSSDSGKDWLGPDVRESLFNSYDVIAITIIGIAVAWLSVGSPFEQPYGFSFYVIVVVFSLSFCLFLYKAFVQDFRRIPQQSISY